MHKKAAIKTELQPHQIRALKKAMENNIILAHSTGSGKTLTSIAAADAIGKPTTVLVPASLVGNYKKELAKHKKGGPPVTVLSLPTAMTRGYNIPEGNTVIIDEAHSLRNPGTAKRAYVKKQLDRAGRVIALTGTPAYNKLADWAPLVNMVSGDNVVPEDEKAFMDRFVEQHVENPSILDRIMYGAKKSVSYKLKNLDSAKPVLNKYVDLFYTDVDKPKREDQLIEVEMDPDQEELYNYIIKKLPLHLRYKVYKNIPPSKQEAQMMNAFLNDVRQVSNTPEKYQTGAKPGAKIRAAVKDLVSRAQKDSNFRAMVYSNYLDSGINSYAKLLDDNDIKYNIFNGSLTAAQKQRVVDDFNSGKVPVILGSGAASEGLDLKGTKLVQILEPHFNNAKIDQVIGRAIRYQSHNHLPEDERKVVVQKYVSKLKPEYGLFGGVKNKSSVDQYLMSRAAEKDELMQQWIDNMKGNTDNA